MLKTFFLLPLNYLRGLRFFVVLFSLLFSTTVGCGANGKSEVDFLVSRKLSDGLYASINTDRGEIVLELFYEQTPITVANFVSLVEGIAGQSEKKGPFYDGLTFHRVVDNFVIQGGDPLGNGSGGPGYVFRDEIVDQLTFDRPGYLAMANSGPGTNGSQFFITLSSTPHLDGKHTIFGRVVSDEDQQVVRQIKQDDRIKSVTIGRSGEKAQNFDINREKHIQSMIKQKMDALGSEEWKTLDEIFYIVQEKGSGNKPNLGDVVRVHYKGWLLETGKVFDSSYDRGQPLSFSVGEGQVIAGWDKTVLDMQVTEKRLVVLNPGLAYGKSGAGSSIPPHSWLVFEMERVG